MTTSQKNAIYYNYRKEEGIIRDAICEALGCLDHHHPSDDLLISL